MVDVNDDQNRAACFLSALASCLSGAASAFRRVVFPDLLPGILSGFLMAFTMSLDDFIITHFTKGAGVDTLSTKIYTEVRKGIKPEMYEIPVTISAFSIGILVMPIITVRVRFFI